MQEETALCQCAPASKRSMSRRGQFYEPCGFSEGVMAWWASPEWGRSDLFGFIRPVSGGM